MNNEHPADQPNRAASRLLTGSYSEARLREAAADALKEIGGTVSCAFVFATADWRPHLTEALEVIQVHGHVPVLIGCSGSGLIARNQELDDGSGLSMLLLHLPRTKLTSFELSQSDLVETCSAGQERTEVVAKDVDALVVLSDPLTFDIETWLNEWNADYPGIPVCGGLGSGGRRGDEIVIMEGHRVLDSGGIALAFKGGVRIHPMVSQGCRPIGEPFTITAAQENIVNSLGSRPALEALSAALNSLPPNLRPMAQGNIFAGLATSEYIDEFKSGDFLIRNIVGANPDTGAVALAALPRVGQTLQYQLRDRDSAHMDLLHVAQDFRDANVRPFASLLFSCTGRGRSLFGVGNHDISTIESVFGEHPTAGFFCNGEIGPVGTTNFVHGYTASTALFADP